MRVLGTVDRFMLIQPSEKKRNTAELLSLSSLSINGKG